MVLWAGPKALGGMGPRDPRGVPGVDSNPGPEKHQLQKGLPYSPRQGWLATPDLWGPGEAAHGCPLLLLASFLLASLSVLPDWSPAFVFRPHVCSHIQNFPCF